MLRLMLRLMLLLRWMLRWALLLYLLLLPRVVMGHSLNWLLKLNSMCSMLLLLLLLGIHIMLCDLTLCNLHLLSRTDGLWLHAGLLRLLMSLKLSLNRLRLRLRPSLLMMLLLLDERMGRRHGLLFLEVGDGPAVPRKAAAEPSVVGRHHRRRAEILMEGTTEAGVVAEAEVVRDERIAKPMRC